MISFEELQIGSFVEYNSGYYQIGSLIMFENNKVVLYTTNKSNTINKYSAKLQDLEPVLLTREILDRCGLKCIYDIESDTNIYKIGKYNILFKEEDLLDDSEIKYLHQVQAISKIDSTINQLDFRFISDLQCIKPIEQDYYDSPKSIDMKNLDDLFEEAAKLIVQHQQGSPSLIQRKLSLGYNRAGRIIDQLEAAGIVGPTDGSKARQVLITDFNSLDHILSAYLKKD